MSRDHGSKPEKTAEADQEHHIKWKQHRKNVTARFCRIVREPVNEAYGVVLRVDFKKATRNIRPISVCENADRKVERAAKAPKNMAASIISPPLRRL
ncbi:MAG: hypothetical protein WBO09_15305 [Methylocystis silviterrae]|uniref:hypothetical protein n=1 Tax=Methylocystis silviterrae TaxID=2743612 RepID=UPI003C76ED74